MTKRGFWATLRYMRKNNIPLIKDSDIFYNEGIQIYGIYDDEEFNKHYKDVLDSGTLFCLKE